MFALGLFENPFVDEDAAATTIGNEHAAALGARAQRRSVTWLKNPDRVPERPGRVYLFVTGRTEADRVQHQFEEAFHRVFPEAALASSPEEADLAIVWARPEIALFEDDQADRALSMDPQANGVDVERVQAICDATPTVLAVNMINPWLLAELEPGARTLVATFEVAPEQLFRALAGEEAGHGAHLPFAVPASADAIADSPRDVPGRYLGDEYAYVDADGGQIRLRFRSTVGPVVDRNTRKAAAWPRI